MSNIKSLQRLLVVQTLYQISINKNDKIFSIRDIFKQIIEKLLKSIGKKRLLIPFPLKIAEISARFFEMMPNPLLLKVF